MPLTTGEFHTITILPSTAAAWGLLATTPSLPSAVMERVVDGANFNVYCINAGTGSLAFEGGQVFGLVDSVLNSVSAALSKQTVTADDGNVTEWGVDGSGIVSTYDTTSGIMRAYSVPEMAALKAWLP